MNLLAESLIISSLRKKTKHTLKKFECGGCGQIYIYIVKENIEHIPCNICDAITNAKGEI